jgi:hypothetical protein
MQLNTGQSAHRTDGPALHIDISPQSCVSTFHEEVAHPGFTTKLHAEVARSERMEADERGT